MGVYWAKAAAKNFTGQIEIIDLRTLFPLDEDLVFEYEDEESEEKEEEIKAVNILKPKKSLSSEVSNIASELEKNPEWKDLVEEDGEE